MVKIKGWKKLGESNLNKTYVNVSRKWDTLNEPLVDVRRVYRVYRDEYDAWGVQIYGKKNIYKTFPSEKVALNFALEYMRSHPNG